MWTSRGSLAFRQLVLDVNLVSLAQGGHGLCKKTTPSGHRVVLAPAAGARKHTLGQRQKVQNADRLILAGHALISVECGQCAAPKGFLRVLGHLWLCLARLYQAHQKLWHILALNYRT